MQFVHAQDAKEKALSPEIQERK